VAELWAGHAGSGSVAQEPLKEGTATLARTTGNNKMRITNILLFNGGMLNTHAKATME